jgi:hypothetical protein
MRYLGYRRGLFPWKISPQTRAEKAKNARRGVVVVLPSFPKHLDKPAFLTGGLWFVIAATTKP